jgi:hypothetical protein
MAGGSGGLTPVSSCGLHRNLKSSPQGRREEAAVVRPPISQPLRSGADPNFASVELFQ